MSSSMTEPASPHKKTMLGVPDLVILGASGGMLAGALEAGYVLLRRWKNPPQLEFITTDFAWMSIGANGVIGLIVGLVLALFSIILRRPLTQRVALTVIAMLPLLALMLHKQILHPAAMFLLALGIATQLAWLGAKLGHRMVWISRATALVLFLLMVGLGIQTQRHYSDLERTSLAALPPATEKASDIFLLVIDTIRSSSTSLQGYARSTTPQLERLASEGVMFENAWATAPWTLPTHATMFTGHYGPELSCDFQTKLDDEFPTLAEFLSSKGYETAGFAANVIYTRRETGLDRGFAHYADHKVNAAESLNTSALWKMILEQRWLRDLIGFYDMPGRPDAPWANQSVLDWLESRKESDRPRFVFVNYYDAHGPYLPPAPFAEQYGVNDNKTRRQMLDWEEDADVDPDFVLQNKQPGIDSYDACLAYLDDQVGKLVEALKARGHLDNALLIVVSDHGELFGEHGLIEHANALYEPVLRVPFVMMGTALPRGLRVPDMVTLRDLPATIVDLVGLGDDSPFPGQSLARFWNEGAPRTPASPIYSHVTRSVNMPPHFPNHDGPVWSLRRGDFTYIWSGKKEELYNHAADPGETNDLSAAPDHKDTLESSRAERTKLTK